MEFDKICRLCLVEKTPLHPIFNACMPNMLMSIAAIQVKEGDGLPHQICSQCVRTVNRSYTFKTQCEKSDGILRQYINPISTEPPKGVGSETTQSNISDEVLQQSLILNDIFDDAETHSLVDNFTSQNAELPETMQSLSSISEQCLPACKRYKCQYCVQMFQEERSLAEHIKIHKRQTKYNCKTCGLKYKTPGALESHLQFHCNRKITFTCKLCRSDWNDVKTLKKHYRDEHTKENKLLEQNCICIVCGERYEENKLLKIHMRKHMVRRPLTCDKCGKTFSLWKYLQHHKCTHTKKNKCNLCQESLKQSSNLTSHACVIVSKIND